MIHVVEDDAGVRELELYALRQAGYEAEGFAEPEAFRAALRTALPDAVILDVMLPGEDGVSVLRSLRREPRTRRLPVMLVTARDAEMDKVRGLDEGADDYLTKPFGVMELLARIRALLRRSGESSAEECLTLGDVVLDRARHRVTAGGQEVVLTHMEFELLAFLMRHAGRAVTREVLLDDVWGMAYAGDTRTVDVHIRTLRQKLGDSGSMIATVRGVGYRMEAAHE
ncbi:MAG: winged helix-turn-helix domain-containing protein [Aristaeellaceae bacterium]